MKNAMRKLVLYVLVWAPISSISFAAQAALKMDLGNQGSLTMDDSQIPHGASESCRA